MKRGQQKKIPTPGTQKRVHLFGAYDWHSDKVSWHLADELNSASFVSFLTHLLLTCHPNEKLILVLDNAPIHKSAVSQAALSLFEDRILIIWLPKYCSTELNPIERYWKHLKEQVCVDTIFPSIDDLTDSVVKELQRQEDLSYPKRFRFLK